MKSGMCRLGVKMVLTAFKVLMFLSAIISFMESITTKEPDTAKNGITLFSISSVLLLISIIVTK